MEIKSMNPKPTVLLIGKDTALNYLFNRFAEQSGYQLTTNHENVSMEEIETVKPTAILCLSTDLRSKEQALITERASRELPILVCSSVAEEARARELGADYCLLHPLTYDDFQKTLDTISSAKHP